MAPPLLLDTSLDELIEGLLHVMSSMGEENLDIDQPCTADGATLLHLAARAGKVEVVRRLVLDLGAD